LVKELELARKSTKRKQVSCLIKVKTGYLRDSTLP
jgi:hypothetical protein